MKLLLLLIIILLPVVILGGALYVLIMLPIKNRNKKLNRYADEIGYNLRNSGIDKHYDSLSTDELLNIYQELNNMGNTLDYKKDLYRWAEVGCKAKLIEDIFNTRGITIPEWK